MNVTVSLLFTVIVCFANEVLHDLAIVVTVDDDNDGFQRTTRRYIPDDRTLRNHRCDDLIS
jgi:hypothetical protein